MLGWMSILISGGHAIRGHHNYIITANKSSDE